MIQDGNKVYEIKDISVASFLYATQSLDFIGKKRNLNGDVTFLFSPQITAEKLVQSYWNLDAPAIQPKLLFSALRDLKDIIFGG
jgi:hypothetical protein